MIGIYKITNKITGQTYVGQSGRLESRLSAHKKTAFLKSSKQYNDPLYKDIRQYGIKNFDFEILETVSLYELEEKWIQKEVSINNLLYNKSLYPCTDMYYHARMFGDSEIDEIIGLLKINKLSNIAISKIYNCSPTTIDDINNGKRYVKKNTDYPVRIFAKNIGSNNSNALYTEEEVMQIRKQYVNKTMEQLFKEFSKNKSLKAFQRVITGKCYGHLPIYNKRSKSWVKDGRPYRLEP